MYDVCNLDHLSLYFETLNLTNKLHDTNLLVYIKTASTLELEL